MSVGEEDGRGGRRVWFGWFYFENVVNYYDIGFWNNNKFNEGVGVEFFFFFVWCMFL